VLIDQRIRIAFGGFVAAGVLGLLLVGWPTERGTFVSHGGPTVAGEIVVQFSADLSPEQQASVLNAHGATLERSMLVPGYAVANVPAGSEEAIGLALAESGVVASAEDNPVRFPAGAPDDPYYAQQWNMSLIGLSAAREMSDGSSVIVAVIDTGVAYENYYDVSSGTGFARAPDLAAGSFVLPCDMWISPPLEPSTCIDSHANDDYGHGTHVTGTIAQISDNGYGTAGIAPMAKIMPIKVCGPVVIDATTNPPTKQEQCSDDRTADGVNYAVQNGADIINLSIAGEAPISPTAPLRKALSDAQGAGVIVIAASGNAGSSTLQYPAAIAGVIAVGAVDVSKTKTSYSNFGIGEFFPGTNPTQHVLDLVAPGGTSGTANGIWQQTYATCTHNWSTDVDFTTFQPATSCRGTSMAAAHVSGVAALIKSKFPNISRVQLTNVLKNCAEHLGTPEEANQYGAGLVRADRSLLDLDSDNVPDCIDTTVVTPHPTPIPPTNECLPPSLSPTPVVTPSPTPTLTPPPNTGPTPTARDTGLPGAVGVEGSATDTPVPTDTLVPTDTPLPTDTPVSTDTPIPTDTPLPTETALPTDTPTERPTDTPTPVPTAPPTPRPVCGDVDCNGAVQAVDALGVLVWLTDSLPSVPLNDCIELGYVNCDTELNVVDAAVILRHSATLPTNLPAGCSGID
jgi:serine protease